VSSPTATAGASRTSKALSGRDLINVGIFSAIYFAVLFGFGMVGFAGPWFAGLAYLLGILANGVVISLYVARVPKVGAITLLGLICSLLMVATGHPWFTILISTALGFAADLIGKAGSFRSPRWNTLAYAVLSLWYIGPMLPVVWDTAGYREYVSSSMGADYAQLYLAVFGAASLPIWLVGFFVVGLVGGWFGQRVLRRQFRRAGVA
jgi:energy-coupling factor transport system substrate-specific component